MSFITLPKLSVASAGLPSGYRRTAYVEVHLPNSLASGGRNRQIEAARFESSTPGQVGAFFSRSESGKIVEISGQEFAQLFSVSLGVLAVDAETRLIIHQALFAGKQALNDVRAMVANQLHSATDRFVRVEQGHDSTVEKALKG